MAIKKIIKTSGLVLFVVILVGCIVIIFKEYRKAHRVSEAVPQEGIIKVIAEDKYYDHRQYNEYEIAEKDYKRVFAVLDNMCGREVFGPTKIGEPDFSFIIYYGEEKEYTVGIYLRGEDMLIYYENQKEERHFLMKNYDPDVIKQLFHPYKGIKRTE